MTEDEMVRWHHGLNGHGFDQTLGDSEGQGSQVCCSPCGHSQTRLTNIVDLQCRIVLFLSEG